MLVGADDDQNPCSSIDELFSVSSDFFCLIIEKDEIEVGNDLIIE